MLFILFLFKKKFNFFLKLANTKGFPIILESLQNEKINFSNEIINFTSKMLQKTLRRGITMKNIKSIASKQLYLEISSKKVDSNNKQKIENLLI